MSNLHEPYPIHNIQISGETVSTNVTGELQIDHAGAFLRVNSHALRLALEMTGNDDYVNLRSTAFNQPTKSPPLAIADRRIIVDPTKYEVTADNQLVPATKMEFELLSCLARDVDRIVEPEFIANAVWGWPVGINQGENFESLRVHIARLRKKLNLISEELGDVESGAIRTVRYVGYRAVSSLI